MKARTIGLATALVLATFSANARPIQLKANLAGENRNFVGTWQAKQVSDYSTRNYDNTVLVLTQDGSALFKHCAKHLVGSTSNVSGTSLNDLVVGAIADGQLTLAKPSFPNVPEQTFQLDSAPYRENGQWYMVLDGTVLRKLGATEKSDFATWECP
jgi:hypothetical protein